MRYLIRISYDGSKFYGFQRLKDVKTVQKSLEDALTKIDRGPVVVKGAGRTDRGVHASDQCVHFDLTHNIPTKGLKEILNKLVGPYIYVKECEEVSLDFHARFSVKQKTYRYRIYFGPFCPQLYDYVFFCPSKLDTSLMKEASKLFLGVHDFQRFVSGERENNTSVIYDISFHEEEEFLDIIFVGKSFYRYMVRNIVGALIDVSLKKRKISEIEASLKGEEVKQFSTAESQGLYLEKIEY
ncbi:MAG: tRNA pseudouridine(38-40) synthase TruA [Bacilli bacterium]|nr:tRNA pseudouridine(38-40) synthase TruA [Bacilli bacterium]